MIFGRRNRPAADLTPVNPIPVSWAETRTSAIDLSKVRAGGHIELAKHGEHAMEALRRRGLDGIRADAVLVLDGSGSMRGDYADGKVQRLVERILGFSLAIDADGKVPVIVFDHRVRPPVVVTVDNYRGIVDRQLWTPDDMGSTDMAGALAVVRDMAAVTENILFVTVAGDGNPDNKAATTEAVCELSRTPSFLKMAALRPVPYFSKLDKFDEENPGRRLVDNCNAQPPKDSSLDLLSCTDEEFQEAMAEELDVWISAAQQAGILK